MLYAAVHFLNYGRGRYHDYADYFADAAGQLGERLMWGRRFHVSSAQLDGSTGAYQPWTGLGYYELEIDASAATLAELNDLIHERPVREGLLAPKGEVAADSLHLFDLGLRRMPSPHVMPPGLPEHIGLVMANYTPGMKDEWVQWYDTVHGPEIVGVPGLVSCSRGLLADKQIDPKSSQPATAIIVHHYRTDDFRGLLIDFQYRARGISRSGVAWSARSPAAALNRTVHMFDATGPAFGKDA